MLIALVVLMFLSSNVVLTGAQIERPGIIAVAAAGNRYAAAYYDRTIRVWDITTQQLLFTIVDSTDTTVRSPLDWVAYSIYDFAFSPDSSLLAASFGGNGGTIRIFDMTDGSKVRELTAWSSAGSIAWKPDGTQLAARVVEGTGSNTFHHIMVWDISTGHLIIDQEIGSQSSTINISWSPDGSQLATADGPYLYLSNTINWSREGSTVFPTGITDITWNPDGSQIAGVDAHGTVYLVEANTGKVIQTLSSTTSTINEEHIAWNAGNQIVATCGGQLFVWEGDTGKLVATVEAPNVSDVVWLSSGQLLYGSYDTLLLPVITSLTDVSSG